MNTNDLDSFGADLGDDMRALAGTLDLDPGLGDRVHDRADDLTSTARRRAGAIGAVSVIGVLALGTVVLPQLFDSPEIQPIAPIQTEASSEMPTPVGEGEVPTEVLDDGVLDSIAAMTLVEIQARIGVLEAERSALWREANELGVLVDTDAVHTDPDAIRINDAFRRIDAEREALYLRKAELIKNLDASAGLWDTIPSGPIAMPLTAAWDGTELLVMGWCGEVGCDSQLAAYNPTTKAWTELAKPPIAARGVVNQGGNAFWTGSELLIVGGPPTTEGDPDFPVFPTVAGAAYTRSSNSWSVIPEAPIRPRVLHTAVWTGDELIIWGGMTSAQPDQDGQVEVTMFNDGAAWNPTTSTWRVLAASPMDGRGDHGAVWDGSRMLVMGGGISDGYESEFGWDQSLEDVAAYDPATDSWETLGVVEGFGPTVATVWTGDRLLHWNGDVSGYGFGQLDAGILWDPASGDRTPISHPPLAAWRDGSTFNAWAPEIGRFLTWGGGCGEGCNNIHGDGASFDPATNSWKLMNDAPVEQRNGVVGAWTGTQLLILGGYEQIGEIPGTSTDDGFRADGAAWTPWTP